MIIEFQPSIKMFRQSKQDCFEIHFEDNKQTFSNAAALKIDHFMDPIYCYFYGMSSTNQEKDYSNNSLQKTKCLNVASSILI